MKHASIAFAVSLLSGCASWLDPAHEPMSAIQRHVEAKQCREASELARTNRQMLERVRSAADYQVLLMYIWNDCWGRPDEAANYARSAVLLGSRFAWNWLEKRGLPRPELPQPSPPPSATGERDSLVQQCRQAMMMRPTRSGSFGESLMMANECNADPLAHTRKSTERFHCIPLGGGQFECRSKD